MASSIHKLREGLSLSAPGFALFISIILLIIPLRLGQGFVPTPFFPLMIVFLYSVYEPNALSAPVVFALGLLHDLLYGGSFGLWASVYLAMQYLVYTQREYLNGRVGRVIWLAFALATLSVITLYWLEQSLLGGRWMPLMPLVTQTVLTILLYPAASFLFFSLKIRAAAQRAERGEAG